jgi:hypothetical protein
MDDGGFFGRNRLYYYWMLKKYKEGVRVEKLKYWMFQKEMKEWQKRHVTKIRTENAKRHDAKTGRNI